eukprot:6337398-Prymnesium_polylepis.1
MGRGLKCLLLVCDAVRARRASPARAAGIQRTAARRARRFRVPAATCGCAAQRAPMDDRQSAALTLH